MSKVPVQPLRPRMWVPVPPIADLDVAISAFATLNDSRRASAIWLLQSSSFENDHGTVLPCLIANIRRVSSGEGAHICLGCLSRSCRAMSSAVKTLVVEGDSSGMNDEQKKSLRFQLYGNFHTTRSRSPIRTCIVLAICIVHHSSSGYVGYRDDVFELSNEDDELDN